MKNETSERNAPNAAGFATGRLQAFAAIPAIHSATPRDRRLAQHGRPAGRRLEKRTGSAS